jgi:ribosomal protein L11 methylase PrmA
LVVRQIQNRRGRGSAPIASGPRVVTVAVPAGVEADLAADALWGAGAIAIEERETPAAVMLTAGVAPGADVTPLLDAVAGSWPAEVVPVDIDGALDAWRAFAGPVAIGERLLVRPPWVASEHTARVDVPIDPGRAFGSGAHASTRLALVALERLVRGGERVLDAGCGSGVLGIAALALGAAEAVGVDHDPEALAASRANATRNGVGDRFTVTERPIDEVVAAGAPFDLVTANLLLPDLVAVIPTLRAAVAVGGSVVASGVLADQRPAVVFAATRLGLVPQGEETADGWLAVTFAGPTAG